ncbi:MAG TPA: hypothetical protein DCX25_04480 [Candidatus Pacebacteria bacterium]|nr:MAG: hypothetical protein UX00_C0007G0055 [Microgenomates group bacterium GW2011_GWB1_45_17]KKU23416.1 MAG: hypothetical protein UX35_C0006G0092 [Microgenomates group bacterium GW2011_GWA1_46_15]KKU24454.1 MAG: hypothetical protein UX36_C0001G0071 [Microgenomates group bacterium GW2011_GWC1_46_15]HAV15557.1 hypothetical protein [Candidatus Paceibacterota bacterium]HCR10883.1 hypothetical protein [Candidatus Paceibacterota bacterium]
MALPSPSGGEVVPTQQDGEGGAREAILLATSWLDQSYPKLGVLRNVSYSVTERGNNIYIVSISAQGEKGPQSFSLEVNLTRKIVKEV